MEVKTSNRASNRFDARFDVAIVDALSSEHVWIFCVQTRHEVVVFLTFFAREEEKGGVKFLNLLPYVNFFLVRKCAPAEMSDASGDFDYTELVCKWFISIKWANSTQSI